MILKEYLLEKVKTKKLPGIAIAYLTEDSNYYLNVGYNGFKEYVSERQAVDSNTLYDLASLTKVVSTTTLILKLIELDYFTLETKVKEILPQFKYDNVTIKHLLTHTSGLPADDKKYKECHSASEMWEFTLNQPQIFEPGTKVEYSDFGYIILGKIIEHFEMNIEEYANKIIFKPLEMNSTAYNPYTKGLQNTCAPTEVTDERGTIRGIVHDGKALKLNGLSGNAGLFSNTKDLTKFVRMILNDGYPILGKESIDLFKQCLTPGLNESRTIGWMFNDVNSPVYNVGSNNAIWHTGFAGGSIYVDFDSKKAVITLTNRVHPSRENDISEIRKEIHKMLLNNEN